MKLLLTCWSLVFLAACGSGSPTAVPVGSDIISKYNLKVTGDPTVSRITLPTEFTGPNWGMKEGLCEEAGYSLLQYSGQEISSIKYNISDTYMGLPLDLYVFAKGDVTICGLLSIRDSSQIPGILGLEVLK